LFILVVVTYRGRYDEYQSSPLLKGKIESVENSHAWITFSSNDDVLEKSVFMDFNGIFICSSFLETTEMGEKILYKQKSSKEFIWAVLLFKPLSSNRLNISSSWKEEFDEVQQFASEKLQTIPKWGCCSDCCKWRQFPDNLPRKPDSAATCEKTFKTTCSEPQLMCTEEIDLQKFQKKMDIHTEIINKFKDVTNNALDEISHIKEDSTTKESSETHNIAYNSKDREIMQLKAQIDKLEHENNLKSMEISNLQLEVNSLQSIIVNKDSRINYLSNRRRKVCQNAAINELNHINQKRMDQKIHMTLKEELERHINTQQTDNSNVDEESLLEEELLRSQLIDTNTTTTKHPKLEGKLHPILLPQKHKCSDDMDDIYKLTL